ncbi:MAG: PFL family protein [Fimbriimonadaceae bacterium]|nr:PFL family protein [Fimbriimonadaceae bacterium]
MLRADDILSTIRMFQEEHLDVRAVTLGINLADCASPRHEHVAQRVRERLLSAAGKLVETCRLVGEKYGIPIVNKRIAVSPVAQLAGPHGEVGLRAIAAALDAAVAEVGVDFLGGYSALVQKGMTAADIALIDSLPAVLSETSRICSSLNVATSRAGLNIDAVNRIAVRMKELAERTADRDGFGCAKLVVFANIPEDSPFMAGAYLGAGEPDVVVNIGVSGPGVVKRAIERLRHSDPQATLQDVAEEIKTVAFRITRVGELIGREVAMRLGVPFGIVDLSLAPTPEVGDSIGEILEAMGIASVGAPGSTAAVAMLNDAVKKGGAFASSSVGGLSGAFIPVAEDRVLAQAVADGHLTLAKLEALTSVCSVGLDMVAIPGATTADTIAAIIADEMAIGVINHKTTAARLVPVPGKGPGEIARFGGLFGESAIIAVPGGGRAASFLQQGGRIPAPLHSLRN